MQEFSVFAPAKLNLYLDVLDKRPDGYHNIKTLFEKIDLKDEIIIREKDKGISVTVEPALACPSGKDNIVYKALQALLGKPNVNLGLEVIIKKQIPVSAGLGGGSSNAASVLRAVNKAFELGLSSEALFSIAAETGKDVPFFMLDQSFAIGRGAGELLEPIDTACSFSHVIIKPDIAISTAEMYKGLEKRARGSRKDSIEEIVSAIRQKDIALLGKAYYNVFEKMLGDYSQHMNSIRGLLFKVDAGPGFLSGSGPSIFCTVKEREEAIDILEKLSKAKGTGTSIFLATTYKGGIYGDNRGQDIS
ncbi:4-(cytidine 5'-diphospho)-2-C-methyl-D-erythritol kinase [Candidatus Omnitrophota bacterium]